MKALAAKQIQLCGGDAKREPSIALKQPVSCESRALG